MRGAREQVVELLLMSSWMLVPAQFVGLGRTARRRVAVSGGWRFARGLAWRWLRCLLLWVSAQPVLQAADSASGADLVESRLNISYAENTNPRQALDLYLPKKPRVAGRLPVVVFIHGGGWQNGSKAAGAAWLQPYVASGAYAGVAVGYRLAGEAPWPAQIYDCKAAIRWIRANAAQEGLNPDKIGVVGNSAGGTLAILLAASGGHRALEGEVGSHGRESSLVACVLNYFGRIDFLAEPAEARAAPEQAKALEGRLKLLFGGALAEKTALARAASPLHYVSAATPPILTVHGTQDALVPYVQALSLDAAMRRAGAAHLLLPMVGFGHGFQNAEANRRARLFFDLHLRGGSEAVSVEPIVASPKK